MGTINFIEATIRNRLIENTTRSSMEETYYRLLNDILCGYNRNTPTKITNLQNNQIFIFGTDKVGSQKYGAAGLAARCFGAKPGVFNGPTGMCYALPTMGFSEEDFAHAVAHFERYVRTNMHYTYLVTAVGCGHAGLDVKRTANMFRGLLGLTNVMLPELFLKVYRMECYQYFSSENIGDSVSESENNDPLYHILRYYEEEVHEVIHYLVDHKISFNPDGGFVITDRDGSVIAEAELGIEDEKIVFFPFNSQSEITFKNCGYQICSPEDYLNSKQK